MLARSHQYVAHLREREDPQHEQALVEQSLHVPIGKRRSDVEQRAGWGRDWEAIVDAHVGRSEGDAAMDQDPCWRCTASSAGNRHVDRARGPGSELPKRCRSVVAEHGFLAAREQGSRLGSERQLARLRQPIDPTVNTLQPPVLQPSRDCARVDSGRQELFA
jgi:hypothetical protein